MRYYNTIAKSYNELHGQEQLEKAQIILKYIKPKGILLDIGAGTGITTKLFEKYCRCIALDPSEKLIEQYQGEKIISIAEKIPFPDNYFDTIISITALHHTNIKKALKEILRVAKQDAHIAITVLKKSKVNLSLFKNFKKIDCGKDWLFINEL